MKKLEFKELLAKTIKELVKLRNDLKSELFQLRMKNAVRWLKELHFIRITRRNIARINTALNHKLNNTDGNNMR